MRISTDVKFSDNMNCIIFACCDISNNWRN